MRRLTFLVNTLTYLRNYEIIDGTSFNLSDDTAPYDATAQDEFFQWVETNPLGVFNGLFGNWDGGDAWQHFFQFDVFADLGYNEGILTLADMWKTPYYDTDPALWVGFWKPLVYLPVSTQEWTEEPGTAVFYGARIIPEPSTLTLLGLGILGLIGYRWKKSV